MKFSVLLAAIAASSATATTLKKLDCPAIWSTVSTDLTEIFLGTDGQCTDLARAAIRAAFHDCGAWNTSQGTIGGCDGSLILANETARSENDGLQDISATLLALATERGVGVADMLQFAGSHAVVTCPGGPQIRTYVGRIDSSTPAPDGLLPDVNAPATDLLALFAAKGFDAEELAALVGAHTTSKQFFADTEFAGYPQDSTPGLWDTSFYSEVLAPSSEIYVLASDKALSQDPNAGPEMAGFARSGGKWNSKFSQTFEKLSLLGVPGGSDNLADCTDFLPEARAVKKRMAKEARSYMPYHSYH